MLAEIKTEVQTTIAPLITGLFEDSKTLLSQELALARSEIKAEVAKAKAFTAGIVLATLLIFMSLVFIGLTAAHALLAAFPEMGEWGAFGVVALIFMIGGAASYLWGRSQF